MNNNNNTFACEKCGAPVLVSGYDVSKKCPGCGHSNNAAAGRARSGSAGGKSGLVLVGVAVALVGLGGAGYFVAQAEAPPPSAAEEVEEDVKERAELNVVPEPEAKASDNPNKLAAAERKDGENSAPENADADTAEDAPYDPHKARAEALREAEESGVIGRLSE